MLKDKLENVETRFGFYHFSDRLPDDLMQIWKAAGRIGGLGQQEYEFCTRKILICNATAIADPNNRFSWEFSRLSQPAESQVKRAMIWGDANGYQIKAGGGAVADCAYTSVLKGLITDKQGNDREVLVIKKYSTVFSDVLITGDEIAALEEAVMAKPARSKALYDDLCLTIRLLIAHYLGQPTMRLPGGKQRTQTKDEILEFWEYVKLQYPPFIVKKYFSRNMAESLDADIVPLMEFLRRRFELLLAVGNVADIKYELTADYIAPRPATVSRPKPVGARPAPGAIKSPATATDQPRQLSLFG